MSKKFKAVVAKLKGRRRADSTKVKMAAAVSCINEDAELQSQLELVTTGVDSMDINPSPPPPSLPIPPSGTFDFAAPASSPQWPGPRYDDLMQFVPGIFNRSRDMMLPKTKTKAKRAITKRSTSHEDRHVVGRLGNKATKPTSTAAAATARWKQATPKKPQFYQSPPAREQPLHLLDLPGEIRNEIFRYLYISKEPLHAKYRPIIQPHCGDTEPDIKRFPREPTLALVCKQLRSEAASLFYAENTFVFSSSSGAVHSYSHLMTSTKTISRWMRASTSTAALTRVELRLGDRTSLNAAARESVKYVFRRLADGSLEIALEPGALRCVCFDEKFCAKHLRDVLNGGSEADNLLKAVMALVDKRSALGLGTTRPVASRAECRDCGKLRWAKGD